MISLFNPIKRKKGFTIIELVVVMAIMGVILAMVLPAFFTSDKPAKGNALAKDFFYKAQDVMSVSKIAYPDGLGKTPAEKILYAVIDDVGGIAETGSYNKTSGAFTAFNSSSFDMTTADDVAKTENRFNECCENYFIDIDKMAGIVFARVDENFAVQACYWMGMTKDEFGKLSDKVFDDDNVIDGFYCGAFPGRFVDKDETFLG